ncbi:LOW QUALITY PROTEIN: enoyl-CoA delta isomerase 1, mitochondrial-like [Drosophila sulfurigaster albostrigata]|uniref:LOW QUALITY PROTEIN: enoyl-CoA delta isomerase 1, mitochondrial-like n=1 Tax=Drosophila sulfurigaster albostrigata TaxID=89887 RepID=UPI002D218266|nr:LOW QUALITY PROTEIN: enoyl-CoA delta isomerase 1, mitochondrial-like [Drosophila sulfurigaster albostrigata]
MLRSQTKLFALGRRQLCRSMSKSCDLTLVEVDDKTGIATLTMNKPPVNSCNLDMMRALKDSMKQIEGNKSRGIILTSSNNKVFSSGLDLNELRHPEQERLVAFWRELQEMWLTLYLSNLPTAAAINGHALAVGCVMASACEYRVMLPGFTIGIHATKFGYVVPPFIVNSYLSVLPRPVVERALLQGKIFSTEEAQQINLIDEVAISKEQALSKCASFIGSFAEANPVARALTKRQLRAEFARTLLDEPEAELKESLEYITSPLFQDSLDAYLAKLKSKNKK